jgi:hypothetical protein
LEKIEILGGKSAAVISLVVHHKFFKDCPGIEFGPPQ